MKKNIFPIFILFFFLGSFSFGFLSVKQSSLHTLIPIAYADDDEDDDDDDDDDEDDDDRYETKSIRVEKAQPIYKTVLVPIVKITIDPIFTIDSDRDGLFDGIDPHPKVHEREYFTDDDDDGVANAFDLYKGEDDFSYYSEDTDINENGIIDSYETMGSR
ncbi:MAG TPA: hypothetical protein DHV33_01240 [Candidatus Moranbacteria bacterium]|nr:hypothetical protein [Candidatus Moranbacteria bacterium]